MCPGETTAGGSWELDGQPVKLVSSRFSEKASPVAKVDWDAPDIDESLLSTCVFTHAHLHIPHTHNTVQLWAV